MKVVAIILCLFTFFIVSDGQSSMDKKEVLSSFCQLSISEELKQTNLSFTDGYTFKIDRNGKPFETKKILGKYLADEQVNSCLNNWRLSGFAENTRFNVYFTWKHGIGWTQMKISSKNFSQITLPRDVECSESK